MNARAGPVDVRVLPAGHFDGFPEYPQEQIALAHATKPFFAA